MANVYLQDSFLNNDLYNEGQENPILSKLDSIGALNVLSVSKSEKSDSLETSIVIHNDLTAPFCTDKSYATWLAAGFNRAVERGDLPVDSNLNIKFESSTHYNASKAPVDKRSLHANYKDAFHNQANDDGDVGLFIYGAWEPDISEKVDGVYTTTQDECYSEGWNSYLRHRAAGTPIVTFCRGSHAALEDMGVRLSKGESEDSPNGNKIKSVATMTRVSKASDGDFLNKQLPEEIKQQVSRIFRCNEDDINELKASGALRILYSSPEEGIGSAVIELTDYNVCMLLGHPEAGICDVLGEDARDILVRGGKTPDGKIELQLTDNVYPNDFDARDLQDLKALENEPFIQECKKGMDGNVELAAEFVMRAFVHSCVQKKLNGQQLTSSAHDLMAKHGGETLREPNVPAFG